MIANQYIVSPAVVSEHFDDEVIIVNMSRGHYYSLRGSSAIVWQGLEAGLSTASLLEHLSGTYTLDTDIIRQPLTTFLEQLITEELLTAGVPSQMASIPVAPARQPFAPPVLEIYTDMADLLTLDPIHDVSPVEGWPMKK